MHIQKSTEYKHNYNTCGKDIYTEKVKAKKIGIGRRYKPIRTFKIIVVMLQLSDIFL